jgi:hypothetical protein
MCRGIKGLASAVYLLVVSTVSRLPANAMPLSPSDITPGLVLLVDTTQLRALGSSQTNAELGASGDRAVTGTTDFLVVGMDRGTGVCTAVPLFPKAAVGNQPLDDEHKRGGDAAWRETPTYFSRWQHWRVPVDALIAALDPSESQRVEHRQYATGDGPVLDDIRVWESRNRAEYRPA